MTFASSQTQDDAEKITQIKETNKDNVNINGRRHTSETPVHEVCNHAKASEDLTHALNALNEFIQSLAWKSVTGITSRR